MGSGRDRTAQRRSPNGRFAMQKKKGLVAFPHVHVLTFPSRPFHFIDTIILWRPVMGRCCQTGPARSAFAIRCTPPVPLSFAGASVDPVVPMQ